MPTPRPPLARPPMARGPAPRPARPAARRAPAGDVDTMKVAGVLFCLSAVASVVVAVAGQGGGRPESGVLGGAFAALVFGAALYQGVGAVRVLVLVGAGLAALASLVGVALLNSVRELQALLAALLLVCLGYVVLLLEKQSSRPRVAAAVSLVALGAAGSIGAGRWLDGLERRAFGRELRPLLADQRDYADAAGGVSLRVPTGWSLLEKDAELFASVPAKVKLADPDAGTVAFLNDEPRSPGLLTLDHYLDGILEAQKESGLAPKQKDRRDTAVGKAPARRMSLGWTHGGRPYSGFVSVWLDGPRVFTLFGAAVGDWSEATEERFRALEAALRFSAPVETALSGAERRLTLECPLFTADAVRMIGRRIPPDSPTEAYFRTGWSWAIRGQGQVDAAVAAELRDLMGAVFSRMSPTDRSRYAAYAERLRGGAATTPAEDAAVMKILGRAAASLPEESLSRLRAIVDSSVTVGGLM